MTIGLDASYSIGAPLAGAAGGTPYAKRPAARWAVTGVGVYSREILWGIAEAHPEAELFFYYRPNRILRSFADRLPPNCRRRLLEEWRGPRSAALFHGLNQRLPRVPLRRAVSTFHDLFVLTGEYSTPEFRRRFAEQARDAAARSDLIIAVSEFTALQVAQLLEVERGRLRVVPHGVHVPPGVPAAPRENVVLHVGALQRRKNVARLVKAFERLPSGWRLRLAGSFGFGAEEILAQIQSSPRRADIEALGYIDRDELAALYRRAAIFAFPSLDEGFGIPVLEAMAHGVPVVVSNRSALPEVAGDAGLLVDPEDVDAIAGALVRLAGDPELREELAGRGIGRARAFTWESAAARTWAVYQELL